MKYYKASTGALVREKHDGTCEQYRDGINGWKPCVLFGNENLKELTLDEYLRRKRDIDGMT